jgi:transmembrane sensor
MTGEAQFANAGVAQSAIEAQAAEWLIGRLHDKDWTTDRQAQLEAWFAESVAHEVAYLRLEAGWNGADRLAVLRAPVNEPRPANKAASRVKMIYSVGVLFLCVALGVLSYAVMQPADRIFVTPVGGYKTIALADGSQIELNTDTELRLSQKDRHATLLRGEAYFRIVHHASHPFSLDVGTQRVVDLGTQFSVRRNADELRVAMVEGRARIESVANPAHSQSVVLNRGDVATAAQGRLAVARKPPGILQDALSWRKGFVVFHHATLGAAADEINRYNTEKIVIADRGAASRVFGGKFRTNDAGRFANVVAAALALQVERRGNEIVISR